MDAPGRVRASRLSAQVGCQIFACDEKVLNFFFTVHLQCRKTPSKTVMLKYPRLFLTSPGIAICTVALFLSSCATFTESSSQVTVQQLENAHLAFINHHTCVEGTRATWDQASFDKEVADITQQFTAAEAAVSKTCLRARNSSGIPLTSFSAMLHSSRSSIA